MRRESKSDFEHNDKRNSLRNLLLSNSVKDNMAIGRGKKIPNIICE